MTRRLMLLSAPLLALSACQTPGADNPPPMLGKATAPSADTRAPAFVEAACGGCHAVEPPFLSPNPASPSFAAIANRRGLSEKSLAAWLAEAHNYPEEMDFTLTRPQIDQIARYMVTLRHAGYVPDECPFLQGWRGNKVIRWNSPPRGEGLGVGVLPFEVSNPHPNPSPRGRANFVHTALSHRQPAHPSAKGEVFASWAV
jgi:mono/diheme cytochrome c family protein